MSEESEVILYLETADGKTMAVPESKLKEFQALNEKIRARQEGKKQESIYNPPQREDIKTKKKNRSKKHIFLIIAYIVLIIIELFFYVPYHRIQISNSEQNVPHTVIIGSGYETMDGISIRSAYTSYAGDTRSGERVNTPQLFMNVSITTIIAAAIYFLPHRKE